MHIWYNLFGKFKGTGRACYENYHFNYHCFFYAVLFLFGSDAVERSLLL